MTKLSSNSILISTVLLAISGCNNSTSNTKVDPLPVSNTPEPVKTISADEHLKLDYRLALSSLGVSVDTLAGATFNLERGEFVLLGESGRLIYMSPEGVISAEALIVNANEETYTGIEHIDGLSYALSTAESRLLLLNEENYGVEQVTQLDFPVNAISYDENTGSFIVIDDGLPSRVVLVEQSGEVSENEIEVEIKENSVTGLTIHEDLIIAASVDNEDESSLIIGVTMSGEIGPVWSIDSEHTSGLVLMDPAAPEIMTTNSDPEQTITLYESSPEPSIPSEQVLTLEAEPELGFDQPSGVDFDEVNSDLYFVTDFGEVRKGDAGGTNELLFEVEEQQGSFEAIVYHESSNSISLIMSDEATEENSIIRFSASGELLERFIIPVTADSHKFESLDYHKATNSYYTITASEGEKLLYKINGGDVNTTQLPEAYDNLFISGVAISDDANDLYMVTEEWENESELFTAGLMIKLDLTNLTELMRYSIAVEVDGEQQGVVDPSDIAIDEENGLLFITSDIDDSILYIFDGV